MKGKKSVKLQTLPDDGSMDSSGEASQAEFQGELAKTTMYTTTYIPILHN